MKSLLIGVSALSLLVSGATRAETPTPKAVDDRTALDAKRNGPWGFDATGMDRSIAPGKDFYAFVNGAWLARTEIPADRVRFGSFDILRALSEARGRALVESVAAKPTSPDAAKVGAFYAAYMDEAKVEALGAAPLTEPLAAVRAATTREALAKLMGRSVAGLGSSLFDLAIAPDAKDVTQYRVYVGQSGLGLPDRDYYLSDAFAAKKAAYQTYVADQLKAVAWPDAERRAADIVAFETEIAKVSWSREQQRDPVATYNPMTVADLQALAPEFPWTDLIEAADLGSIKTIVVGEKSAFAPMAKLFSVTPIETLQAWQASRIVEQASPYLSSTFVDAQFKFRGTVLAGQPQIKPRWKRAVAAVDGALGEVVGKLYVEGYFTPESKAKMQALVANLRGAMRVRLEKLDWMGPETKAKALQKLAAFNVKVGYPDKWKDYSTLELRSDDLIGNIERSAAFRWDYDVKRLNGPVDRQEWHMVPQTVNAYYNPQLNEIVFPAAILQPPFFDPQADMAINYGAIGGVIGHEITHGFDDQGRQFAADGTLNDWWQPADTAKFKLQTDKLDAQYSAFEPLPGAKIKGQLTMGENIADLGGLLMALDAYHLSLGGKPAPVIDGLTGDQRVFLGWAQVWRAKSRDDALRQQLATDPHSPPTYRVNGVVRNIDAWYRAFEVKPGDALYVPPEQRVRIW